MTPRVGPPRAWTPELLRSITLRAFTRGGPARHVETGWMSMTSGVAAPLRRLLGWLADEQAWDRGPGGGGGAVG